MIIKNWPFLRRPLSIAMSLKRSYFDPVSDLWAARGGDIRLSRLHTGNGLTSEHVVCGAPVVCSKVGSSAAKTKYSPSTALTVAVTHAKLHSADHSRIGYKALLQTIAYNSSVNEISSSVSVVPLFPYWFLIGVLINFSCIHCFVKSIIYSSSFVLNCH